MGRLQAKNDRIVRDGKKHTTAGHTTEDSKFEGVTEYDRDESAQEGAVLYGGGLVPSSVCRRFGGVRLSWSLQLMIAFDRGRSGSPIGQSLVC